MPVQELRQVEMPGFKVKRGKACDTVELRPKRMRKKGTRRTHHHLLQVRTDRISAFDRISKSLIPGKGIVLNMMSVFWFQWLANVLPWLNTHFITADADEIIALYPELAEFRNQWEGRAMLVRKAVRMVTVEAIVRGYIFGSGWKDYLKSGKVCGITLPPGLVLAAQLAYAIFSPSTKAPQGQNDANISVEDAIARGIVSRGQLASIAAMSVLIYTVGAAYALTRGIRLCDTKFEFGLDENGELMLCDEVLTPDSSRFWPDESYEAGKEPPSLDKQFVRDYLEAEIAAGRWSKDEPEAPELPAEVIAKTQILYAEAYQRLTDQEICLN